MKVFSGFLAISLALLLGASSTASSTPSPDADGYGKDLSERLDAIGKKLRTKEDEQIGRRWAQWYNWGNWANGWNNWRNW